MLAQMIRSNLRILNRQQQTSIHELSLSDSHTRLRLQLCQHWSRFQLRGHDRGEGARVLFRLMGQFTMPGGAGLHLGGTQQPCVYRCGERIQSRRIVNLVWRGSCRATALQKHTTGQEARSPGIAVCCDLPKSATTPRRAPAVKRLPFKLNLIQVRNAVRDGQIGET